MRASTRRLRAGVRRSVARAEGRRLAARRALRFCRAARRDGRAHEAFALDHRRQSRPKRGIALPRAGDDRLVPDHDLRRRAALSGAASAGRGRDRRTAPPLLRSVSRGAQRRDRSLAPDIQARRAVRRPFDSLAHPPAFRRRAAGVQPRDQFGRKLQIPDFARQSGRRSRRRTKAWSSTGGSRAAGSPAPTASRTRASRPCSSSSPAAPTCRSRNDPRPKTGRADRRSARAADPRDAQARSGNNALRG